ncbi:unnamed protein product [Heligmosomoides polygyrus]|uniref:Coiled-coil domain-containing protein 183 n=1 Tax=Heligmosomoides polygyrus TaxID=6339 RepID=A0A183G6F9_HELPZ|nr:unnamed protein product [Heligmosomoides polygyrus]
MACSFRSSGKHGHIDLPLCTLTIFFSQRDPFIWLHLLRFVLQRSVSARENRRLRRLAEAIAILTILHQVVALSQEMNDIREELRRVKRELRPLKDAILQLPPPVELRNDIVTHCTSIMHLVEFCDKLRITIDFFYVSNATYGEKERDAKNVELTIENYKTRLNFHFHHLRLLYASAPLLVATRAISSHAWEAMMGHPQKYTMRDGITKKTLLTSQSEIQLIVQDQQQALEEMFAKMRDIRTNVLQKKRAQKDSTQGKILLKLECLNALVLTLRKELNKGWAALNQWNPANREHNSDVPGAPEGREQEDKNEGNRHREVTVKSSLSGRNTPEFREGLAS